MLARASLCLMVKLVRDREVSPVELVEAHLREIDRRNPALNAFSMIFGDEALAQARAAEAVLSRGEPMGLLGGVPVTVKDSFDVGGYPTQSGSRLRVGHRAAEDAAAVERLRSAGAILLGKTNTPELLASYETDNLVTGRTNNPWDPERTPGGSSGGEAAAIAAFCSPGGVASDGGGSIRVPAHFCGVAGLKPTPGRISTRGHYPSLGYPGGLTAVAGPMARTAEDLRLLFSALAGYDAEDPFSTPAPLAQAASILKSTREPRLGVWPQFYGVPVDPEIAQAVERAATLGRALGWGVDAFEPRGLERAPNLWATLFQWPLVALRKLVEGREEELHWTLLEAVGTGPREHPAPPTAEQLLTTLAARDRMRAALVRQLEPLDALLMPVAGIAAFRHRERQWPIAGQQIGLFQAMMPAVVANVLGLPAVTIPMTISSQGLPLGVQLMGRPYEDERLLDAAVRLEEARGPWKGVG
ncbi:MAG: amidase [Bryobacteraceae bacterium]